jgi:DNA-binding MarR family transcriptional regulator
VADAPLRMTPRRLAILAAIEAGHVHRERFFPYDITWDRATVTAAVTQLVDAGLVRVQSVGEQARWAQPVALTERGRAVLTSSDMPS